MDRKQSFIYKQQAQVYRGLRSIEAILPFTIKHFNTDSGSEFLNTTIWRFTGFGNRIKFTCSRPYKKKRQLLCGAKNYTHVRELFGYDRLEDPELVAIMNDIYENCWLPLQNFLFLALSSKKNQSWSKNKEKYDSHKLPIKDLCKALLSVWNTSNVLQERNFSSIHSI